MKKVVDCFPFFNEKELLELRVHLLKDNVDEFIICELNYTHSGIYKDFICKQLIRDLDLPQDKIKVLEIKIENDEELVPNDIDKYNSGVSESSAESVAWVRERIQRDAVLSVIDNYSDDTVFILSDCDEIIDPKFIKYFSGICRNSHNNIIKVPLILLEGRGDKRLFENNAIAPWQNSLLMCTAKQLKNGGTPTKMRSNVMNEYLPVWVTENNQMLQDCGWHFTWMGDTLRRKEKANSFIHYANLNSINTLSNSSLKGITSDHKNLTQYSTKNYPVELLPRIIFDLPRVRDFLLPEEDNTPDIKSTLANLYKQFDSEYGEWGWCSQLKSDAIIDCVMETCIGVNNPVCVEIGVYGGKSLLPFGLALKNLDKGIVYGIDPWSNQEAVVGYNHPSHQQFWGNIDLKRMHDICVSGINQLHLEEFVFLLKTTSDNAKQIGDINVLHIDGQHTEQLLRDINKYATKVVRGGYCFVDDVEWSEHTLKSVPLMEELGFGKVRDISGCFLYKKLS